MPVVIGGSGSTGSTLLRTVLNRHPRLFSGEEISFFNKEHYYTDWERYKRYLLAPFSSYRGVRATRGWMPHPGHGLLHSNYGWTADDLLPVVEAADHIAEFSGGFFARPLERARADVWIEKTPSNCYCFPRFLDVFDDARVIHTTRNPLDAVASLVRSGMDPFWASCRWVYCTACSLRVRSDTRYLMVSYELMVTEPRDVVCDIARHLGVDFHPRMLDRGRTDTSDHLREPGWTFSRTDPIQRPKQRSFDRVDRRTRQVIRAALATVRIADKHVAQHGLAHRSCADLCEAVGYDYGEIHPRPEEVRELLPSFRRERRRDMTERTLRGYPTHVGFYPIDLAMEEPRPTPELRRPRHTRPSTARRDV